MPKAIWNTTVIAQSERFETVEGNIYFPPESLDMRYFRSSDTHSTYRSTWNAFFSWSQRLQARQNRFPWPRRPVHSAESVPVRSR